MKKNQIDPNMQIKITRDLQVRMLNAMRIGVLNLDEFPEFAVFRPSTFYDFLKLTSADETTTQSDTQP